MMRFNRGKKTNLSFIFFLYSATLYSMQKIVLVSNDNQEFKIDDPRITFLEDSRTLKNCLASVKKDDDEKITIPIPGLNGDQLGKLLTHWTVLQFEKTDALKRYLKYCCIQSLIDLLNGSSYLEVNRLTAVFEKFLLKKFNEEQQWHYAVTRPEKYNDQLPFADIAANKNLAYRLLKKRRYDLENKYTVFANDPKDPFNDALAFNNDSHQLAVGCSNGAIRLWNPDEKKLKSTPCKHNKCIQSLAFDPHNDKKIITGAFGIVKLWDIEKKDYVRKFNCENREDSKSSIFVNNLIVNSVDKFIFLWDERQPTKVGELSGHHFQINELITNNDNSILSCAGDSRIKKWDLRMLSCIKTFDNKDGGIASLAYRPDYQQFASGNYCGKVQIWNAQTDEQVASINEKNSLRTHILKLNYIKNNHLICHYRYGAEFLFLNSFDSNEIKIFNLKNNHCLKTLPLQVYPKNNVSFSSDGNKIGIIGPDVLRIIECADLKQYKEPTIIDAMSILDLSKRRNSGRSY